MKVIAKYNDSLHNPYWKFQLGPEAYEVRDTPRRVQVIKDRLLADRSFSLLTADIFPERLLTRLHPYHDYIRNTAASLKKGEEFYPDLFPGEGANLPRRVDIPLQGGLWCTDAVTPIMGKTYEVAKASADTALTGAELIADGAETAVYALCRPSGHHAGPRVFGGYCYFNNVATAAEYLINRGRVAVLDIDYHHGNGTQEFFAGKKSVFTASIHGDPAVEYPYFWGYAGETGVGQAAGTNYNEPLPPGTGSSGYLAALDRTIEKIIGFKPRYLIIAAGFDTHAGDPIGGFKLRTGDYREIARRLAGLNLPTLICQEGGYNLEVLGESVYTFLSPFAAAAGK
jgi:acetoin utilization deacetylase AcuC-like enzyme